MAQKKTPNPESRLLAGAIIGGAGLGVPPGEAPPGMAAVLLYVPIECVVGKSPIELQADLGLPWIASDDDGNWEGIWLDELLQQGVPGSGR